MLSWTCMRNSPPLYGITTACSKNVYRTPITNTLLGAIIFHLRDPLQQFILRCLQMVQMAQVGQRAFILEMRSLSLMADLNQPTPMLLLNSTTSKRLLPILAFRIKYQNTGNKFKGGTPI